MPDPFSDAIRAAAGGDPADISILIVASPAVLNH
jgi:hypothetical protein